MVIPQHTNSTAQIKSAAQASNSVPDLRDTVADLCDEVERLEKLVNQLLQRKT